MDRRAAGALLALAACIASAAAAPTAGNQTALDVYDGKAEGCYYNFQHYGEGDRIMTNEPCLNCTCHNRMLMCYLRVCPFTKPIGQDCSVEKRADQCCPIVTCPDVPVDLLTSTSTSSPAEYGETGVGKLDRYGCSINGKYFSEGSKVPSTPNKPCEHCYCIRNMTTCVMQECTLHVDGCTPIYHKDVCCPVRYSCDHPEDEIPLLDDMTTTVRPTPGFLLTTTTLAPVTQMTQDCVHDDKVFADGALIKTEKACQHCYCMKGDIVCVVQECGTPMENEGKNCTSMPPREGQCCPDTYICESDELTTEEKTDFTTIPSSEEITTLPPPRRVIVEGSGYRNEPDEPYTEVPTLEPETEGSGEESFKPTDAGDMLIPEKETPSPILTTGYDENVDQLSTGTTKMPIIDSEITEKATTEPDKGENTVPGGSLDEDTSEVPTRDNITPKEDEPADITVPTTDSYYSEKTTVGLEEESSPGDKMTTEANVLTTKPAPITETATTDQSTTLVDKEVTSEKEPSEVTEPKPIEETDKKTEFESTTSKEAEELSTKASDVTDSDVVTTESSIASVEQAAKTTAAQLPEEDNEVLLKEQTTESSVQSSKPDAIETQTDRAEIITEVPTASEVGTTPVNPVDNEIDEEPFPTSSPGRIPGEGDCLLDGITYRNESVVPSTNNCHSSCKCISSIVKCDPIICSAPPDYMDNCQPMYDSPESCCPTYVCDHTKETVPPQSHSQMSGTESPVPTPSIECDGDQCEIVKDKDESAKPSEPCTSEGCAVDSSKKPETKDETDLEPQPHPSEPAEDCTGNKCTAQQQPCTGDVCKTPATKDQSCDSEHGCTLPVEQPCQGEDCKTQQEPAGPAKDDTIPCNSPDGCKEKVPERTSDCNGESCISEPSTVDTADKQKCDGGDCGTAAQAPETECNEESCVQKPVSDISKLPTGVCTDSECTPQDKVPQITDAPVSDLDVPQATDLPISHETERGDITDVTKTPERVQPSKTTSYEGTESTTQYSEKDHKEEESMPSVTTAPELETQTTEVQQHDTQTEVVIEKQTTISPFEDLSTKMDSEVTSGPKEEITTQKPKLSPSDTEDQTELPDIETKLPESESTDQSLIGDEKIDVPVTTSSIDSTNEVKQDASTEAVTETEFQYKETTAPSHKDKDQDSITTSAPEFELKQDEVYTEAPSKEGPIEVTKEPSLSVTEPTETETTAVDQKETDKAIDESIDKESTSPKYDTETQSPIETTSEGELYTNAPETTLAPVVEGENKETELPVIILPSEEPATSKPDDLASVSGETTSPSAQEVFEKADTKSTTSSILDTTSKPEVSIDDSSQVPEISTDYLDSHVTEPQEITTKQTVFEETDVQSSVTPTEKAPSDLEAVTPMSITKDHGDDERAQTTSDYLEQEQGTKKPDDLIPHGTEIYPTDDVQATSVKPEIEKDSEKMPTLSDEEQVATKKPEEEIETTSPISRDETSSEQPIQESGQTGTESAVSEASTDKAPATIPSDEKLTTSGHELPITEPTVKETASPQESISESVPHEIPDIEKSDSFTELPTKSETEAVDIVTPTRDESGVVKEDKVTDIPELTIHEHVDSIHTTIESGDIVTEKVTSAPDTFATTPRIISDKEVTAAIESTGTSTPEIPVRAVPEEEYLTSAPEHQQTEIGELKPQDVTTNIPEQAPTEAQPITTEAPESQDTATGISDTQEKTTEILTLDITTSAPKIPVSEAEEEQTRVPEPQDINVPEITTTKDLHRVTEAPSPQDVSTTISEIPDIMSTKHPEVPQQLDISTTSPEVSEIEPHKESPEKPDTTPSVADSTVAKDKDVTKTPEMQDADTKLYETPTTESQQATTASPESQETESKAPETLVTEAQEKIPEVPDMQDVVTNMPEILVTEPQKETTEVPEGQDVSASIPVMPVTETQKDSTESQKEETQAPQESSSEIPEEPVTESGVSDVSKDSATSIPEISVTETQFEGTEIPESHDTESNVPEITTESQKEASEPLEPYDVNVIPQAPETESPMKVTEQSIEPHEETTAVPELDSEKHDTESPEIQTLATNAPTISETEPGKQVTSETEEQELVTKAPETVDSDKVTQTPEPQTIATNAPDIPDLPKDETELSGAEVTTQSPEILATEPFDIVTEAPSQEFATKPAERTQTEAETEEPAVTEKDVTESPLKITTKSDDHTEPTAAETGVQTESPTVETSSTVPTEPEISNELTSKIPESLVTELDEKTTETAPSKIDEDKKDENIVTEMPIAVPTKMPEHMEPEKSDATELPISQVPVEFETESPHKDDTKLDVTEAPEIHVTEEVQYVPDVSGGTRKTEITTPTFEQEEVTKAPEEPYQTSETKLEVPETTPYLVLLEEHTHKQDTISPSDEITTAPPGLPLEYEPSTPEPTIDKVTEPAPETESEKPDEDVKPIDIDQDSEKIETQTPEKVTEPTLVSEDITTMPPSAAFEDKEIQTTEKPVEVESNEISTSAPTSVVEQSATQKPFIPESTSEADQNVPVGTEKQPETSTPEEEFIFATTRATTVKVEEELTTLSPLLDKFGKPEVTPQPAEEEKPKPDIIEEVSKPVTNEVQPTEEVPQPDEESHFPPTGTSSYGQEPDYGEEDQAFGPGTCRYGGKVYVSAQQIPRDDPCDFCFCFRSDIICLQQSCPPPIHGCHEEPIQGFCCPRYECPVSMANSVNVTTTTTTTTTTLPPHFLPHAYGGMVQRRGCQIKGHTYKVGEVVRASSGPCLHCTCGGDGQMKCDPKVCTPEPMLRQMIAAAVASRRRR